MTSKHDHAHAPPARGNARAGVTATRILVAGEGWDDGDEYRRADEISSCDAVIWDVSRLDWMSVFDAIGAATRGKLCAFGREKTFGAAGIAGVSYLGSGVNSSEAAELAAIYRSHSTRRVWLLDGSDALALMRKAESPAEARFAVHAFSSMVPSWEFRAQVRIGRYRADFTVTNDDSVKYSGGQEKPCRIAIEIDGHQWHERTKEQAARDKARDRTIQAEGWKVFRFTGSDVWNHPERCVTEVYDVMVKNEREWMPA